MSKFVKRSVAVLARRGGQMLTIRRPDEDDELPGVWGLPAGTLRENESIGQVIHRIGCDKLGVELTPTRLLARGSQDRPSYVLDMELWEVRIQGDPTCLEWKWAPPEVLIPGALSGSLCCRLALETAPDVPGF